MSCNEKKSEKKVTKRHLVPRMVVEGIQIFWVLCSDDTQEVVVLTLTRLRPYGDRDIEANDDESDTNKNMSK